ncbi:hypothetical protein HK096_009836 [Nowakowskiella sp. JEL0078]|nr:hypothetical protein HK096_009836 [Nowakowskiella sp. JEL0078]
MLKSILSGKDGLNVTSSTLNTLLLSAPELLPIKNIDQKISEQILHIEDIKEFIRSKADLEKSYSRSLKQLIDKHIKRSTGDCNNLVSGKPTKSTFKTNDEQFRDSPIKSLNEEQKSKSIEEPNLIKSESEIEANPALKEKVAVLSAALLINESKSESIESIFSNVLEYCENVAKERFSESEALFDLSDTLKKLISQKEDSRKKVVLLLQKIKFYILKNA